MFECFVRNLVAFRNFKYILTNFTICIISDKR